MWNRLEFAVAGLAVAALSACGGGSGGTTTGTATSARATVVTGTMVKSAATAITVNGIRFDVSGATINIDDHAATAADLRTGMRARVRGSDDGGNGRADDVEVENEVRGAVTAVSAATTPQFFNIGDVKVIVDVNTIFDDLVPASFAAIQVGVFVEVNGTRDAAGNIMATRVEGKGVRNPNAPDIDELRGTISAVNAGASQFNVGAVTVSFTAATTFTPAPRCSAASLATGLEVEAHGAFTAANAFAATRIDCEDMEDDEHDGMGNGAEASVEGFVANLDTTARTFTVDGQLVSYSTTTEFRNGTVDDLVANAQVEVEGTLNGTTLVAREIDFERTRIVLTAAPSAVGTDSLTLFGEVVQVNGATEIRTQTSGGANSTSLADIVANNDRVEVRAFLSGSTLVAERVTEIGNSGDGRDVVQARVVAENAQALTLGLLDAANPINVSLAGASFEGDEGQGGSAAQFLAAVVVASATKPGSLVKVRGHFAGGVLTADEVEIEQ